MKQVSNNAKSLFPRYRFVLLLAVIAILAGSCQKGHDHIKRTVPLNAQFQDSVTLLVPYSPGVLEQARIDGWGSGTPIGKSIYEDQIKVDMGVSPEAINGVEVIITENGDKIFSTFTGYSPDPDEKGNFEVFNTATITGGTGKFAGATGTYTITAKGNFSVLIGTATYAGTITY